MDYQDWLQRTWDTEEEFAAFEQEMAADLQRQLEACGLVLLKTVSRPFRLSGVVENANATKWLHVLTEDVRDGAGWFDNVSLRRMSSQSDWKGSEFHYHRWDEVGAASATYMADAYDSEAI
ncbi:MAG: hypothetical protein J5804_01945 [Eggerthellaceae bacterium]|nr:hypothetical protein [Eggerthellaceae bacterium]